MAKLTQEEKKKEFQDSFKAMNESEKGREAYKATFDDQSKAENLLSSGGGEDLGTLENELASLSAINTIRESERRQAFSEDMLFETDIKLGMRDVAYIEAASEINRRKAIKSHRWDKTRKSRMITSRETLTKANDRIRSLKAKLQPAEGRAPLTAMQRAEALKSVYDKIRIADRNFAEAVALTRDEEKKLKDKAELTYRKSMMRMLEREMRDLPQNSREYARLSGLAELNRRSYDELMRPILAQKEEAQVEEALRDLNRKEDKQDEKQDKKQKGQLLVDEKAEELVNTSIKVFSSLRTALDDEKYGKAKDKLWTDMKDKADALIAGWDQKSDLERGDALGDVLIAANRLICKRGKKNKSDGIRTEAAKQFRSFFKSVLQSMSTNCRVLALERIFKKVDELEDDVNTPAALKKANDSIFAELAKESYRKANPDITEDDDALKMIDDFHYRITFANDKYSMYVRNVLDKFGDTKNYMLANLKFDLSRNLSFDMLSDGFRVDRFGNVLEEDVAKKNDWEVLIKEIANADNEKALELQKRFYARTAQKAVDPEWITEKGFKKNAYEVKAFSQKVLSLSNYTTDWKVYHEKQVNNAIRKWNKDHPDDTIEEGSVRESGISRDSLKKQGDALMKLPSYSTRMDVNRDLQLNFMTPLLMSKGINWTSMYEIARPPKMKRLYSMKSHILDHKGKGVIDPTEPIPLIHRDGKEFDPQKDVDGGNKLVQKKKNPLMYKHEKYQPGLYEKVKKQRDFGYLNGDEKHGDVMKRINARIKSVTSVEREAMKKLKALTDGKGDPAELARIDKIYSDYMAEVNVQAIAAESPLLADACCLMNTKDEGYYPELIKYHEQKKKINMLFDELETARGDYIKKYAGNKAYADWKKQLDDQRRAARKEVSKLEKQNASSFEQVIRGISNSIAISETENFTSKEYAQVEKNNLKYRQGKKWKSELRMRVLYTFIQVVNRDFSGAYLSELDKYRADFNKRYKHAMMYGTEEEIKNISREFTEKILPQIGYIDPEKHDLTDMDVIKQEYIEKGSVDYRTVKLSMLDNVHSTKNTDFPLLKTGLDELAKKDPQRYREIKNKLELPEEGTIEIILSGEGFMASDLRVTYKEPDEEKAMTAQNSLNILKDSFKKIKEELKEKPEQAVKEDVPAEEVKEEKPVVNEIKEEAAPEKIKEEKSPEQTAWDEHFVNEKGLKYRIAGRKIPIFSVGDDMDAIALHEKDAVEYGFTSDTLESLSAEELAQMWKGKTAAVADGTVPKAEELLNIRNAYLRANLSDEEFKAYEDSKVGGEDSGATFRLIKEKGLWDVYKLLDLTHDYHVYQEHKERFRREQAFGLRPEVKKKTELPENRHSYEVQTGANCYGCSGSKLINDLLRDSLPKEKQLDQYKVRSYTPRYLSRKEYADHGVDHDYDASRADIEEFAGAEKAHYGNFFAVSDVIFDKEKYGGLDRRDVALHKCTFSLGTANDPNAQANMIEAMKAKLHSVLGSGKPVSFFSKGHYVTIVGLSDNKISYLDSLPTESRGAITKDIGEFLRTIGDHDGLSTTELCWATKITPQSLDALKNEYGSIGINDQTGEVVRTGGEPEFEEIAHRVGIALRKTNENIIKDGNEDILPYMTESVCLHRGAFMNEEQFRQWEERDERDWEKAQQEEHDELQRKL